MSQLVLNFESKKDNKGNFKYIQEGIKAEGHTPVYKMHKYFARRPQNVFRHLIKFYSQPGDILLDCFSGGGVTLFEGLSCGRKTIVNDINPLAAFIADCQTTFVKSEEYKKIMGEIRSELHEFTSKYFVTTCRTCGEDAIVRWFDATYLVKCPKCRKQTPIGNDNKLIINNKARNGKYKCVYCKNIYHAVDTKRISIKLLQVRYKCRKCNEQKTDPVNEDDIKLNTSFEKQFSKLVKKNDLWYPNDIVPENWDRQQEDCLHRKGFLCFSDFFTKRNLYFNALFLQKIKNYKHKIDDNIYKMALFAFSATIRYTNNLTISTNSWMDGRPVAWAKHAFWLPNQFVEVNPMEYFDKRLKAIILGLKYQKKKIFSSIKVNKYQSLKTKKGTHIIWNKSSAALNLPNESIDLVITDPPYGSNVQYGELSNFWIVWLKDELSGDKFDLANEVLVHRKKKKDRKDYESYYYGLKEVFSECCRVLKKGAPLVFTFNNKDFRAWYAVMKAATDAGFCLEPKGVIYQEPIEIYKNTAHTRFSGSIHGDFIYTFRKIDKHKNKMKTNELSKEQFVNIVEKHLQKIAWSKRECSINEMHIALYQKLIPVILQVTDNNNRFTDFCNILERTNFDKVMSRS